jgi:hypothetical protein
MAEIVIGVFPALPDDRIALGDPAVASLVSRLDGELSDSEIVFDTARARDVRYPGGKPSAGGPVELVVELVLPAVTAAAVRAVVDIAVSWLRDLRKADREGKTVDVCGPDGALLATVEVSKWRERPKVHVLLPEAARRRRWRRWLPWHARASPR